MQQRRQIYPQYWTQRYRRSSSSGCVHGYGVISRSRVRLIMCTGGACRPFLHDRYFNAASSFRMGVLRGRLIASSGMLARVVQRWHSTSPAILRGRSCAVSILPVTTCHHRLTHSSNVISGRNVSSRCGWLSGRYSGRLLYSAFAETLLALGRIDFAARLRWLFDPLQPCAITGGANSFHTLTRFFHSDQSLKQNKNLNSFARK
jgi:hypothetical protein